MGTARDYGQPGAGSAKATVCSAEKEHGHKEPYLTWVYQADGTSYCKCDTCGWVRVDRRQSEPQAEAVATKLQNALRDCDGECFKIDKDVVAGVLRQLRQAHPPEPDQGRDLTACPHCNEGYITSGSMEHNQQARCPHCDGTGKAKGHHDPGCECDICEGEPDQGREGEGC